MTPVKKVLFREILQKHHPDKLEYNPKIIEIVGNNVVFEMEQHNGRYCMSLLEAD